MKSIGERLLQAAVAVEVNGQIQDLVTPLRVGGSFKVLTDRDANSLATAGFLRALDRASSSNAVPTSRPAVSLAA